MFQPDHDKQSRSEQASPKEGLTRIKKHKTWLEQSFEDHVRTTFKKTQLMILKIIIDQN